MTGILATALNIVFRAPPYAGAVATNVCIHIIMENSLFVHADVAANLYYDTQIIVYNRIAVELLLAIISLG